MDGYDFSLPGGQSAVGQEGRIHVTSECFLLLLLLGDEFEDVDVVQVVEVLSVKPSKGNHAAAYEARTMSSSRLRVFVRVASQLQTLEAVVLDVDHKQIVEVVTESACEDVDFAIVDC